MAEPHSPKKPLLLRGKLRVLPESKPNPGTTYDRRRQLWLDSDGLPVVSQHRKPSDFGETSRTDSHEGVDQSEMSIIASDFGETTVTRSSEGHDATEVIHGSDFGETSASDFGETTVTKTSEGHDATEVVHGSDFGETSVSATTEGVDVSERADIAVQMSMTSDFGETTKTATHEGSDQTEVS